MAITITTASNGNTNSNTVPIGLRIYVVKFDTTPRSYKYINWLPAG